MTSLVPACKLTDRGVLRIGGDDRDTFLQGLISNDITSCKPKAPLYAALLTPQGKFLHDFIIHATDDAYLLDYEKARTDDLLQRLFIYKLRAKLTIDNVSNAFSVWTGRNSPNDPRLETLGSRGVFGTTDMQDDAGLAAYDVHRMALGVPNGSQDFIVGQSTLAEGNADLLHGINLQKGCYIGQELTARIYHRGLLKKRLFPVEVDGPMPIAGTAITFEGNTTGEMRSSCGKNGLALLGIELVKRAQAGNLYFLCDNAQLKVMTPDWLKPALA